MDRTTSYGDLSIENAVYAKKRMLRTADHVNVTQRYATLDPLPRNMGDTLKLRRYEDWPVTDAPLSETMDPEAIQPTFTDVEVVVEEYGQILNLTKKMADMHQHPVFKLEFKKAGKAAGMCSQKVDFNALKAGTNVYRAGGATSRATIDATVSNTDLKKIDRQLRRDGIPMITERISASTDIATEPVPEGFVAFTHPDMKADLEALDNWLPKHEYAEPAKADPGELGECEGIRFVANKEAPIWETSGASSTTWLSGGAKVSSAAQADIYPIIVVGEDVWTRVPLKGMESIKPMVVNPGKPSVGNMTGRKGGISWVTYLAATITWELGVARLECGATAL